jgi:hypothetical protein
MIRNKYLILVTLGSLLTAGLSVESVAQRKRVVGITFAPSVDE